MTPRCRQIPGLRIKATPAGLYSMDMRVDFGSVHIIAFVVTHSIGCCRVEGETGGNSLGSPFPHFSLGQIIGAAIIFQRGDTFKSRS